MKPLGNGLLICMVIQDGKVNFTELLGVHDSINHAFHYAIIVGVKYEIHRKICQSKSS